MKIIKGNLILKEDTTFNEDLIVKGNIICEGGIWDLKCRYLKCRDLECWDLECHNLECNDLKCRNLECWDLECRNLECSDLECRDLECGDLKCYNLECNDLNFYAFVIAYNSLKCKSWKSRRKNHIIKCLDKEIEITK